MEKLLLTPVEAGEMLSIKRTKMYELMSSGAIRYVEIGSMRRIPRVAVQEFVERLQTGDVA